MRYKWLAAMTVLVLARAFVYVFMPVIAMVEVTVDIYRLWRRQ